MASGDQNRIERAFAEAALDSGSRSRALDPTGRNSSAAPSDEAAVGPFSISDQGVAVKTVNSEVPLSMDALAGLLTGFIARLGFFFWFPVYLAVLVILA